MLLVKWDVFLCYFFLCIWHEVSHRGNYQGRLGLTILVLYICTNWRHFSAKSFLLICVAWPHSGLASHTHFCKKGRVCWTVSGRTVTVQSNHVTVSCHMTHHIIMVLKTGRARTSFLLLQDISLYFSENMHTLQQVFQECIICIHSSPELSFLQK